MANQTEKFSEDTFSILNNCMASNFSDLNLGGISSSNVKNDSQNNTNNNKKAIFCEPCNLYLNSKFVYDQHITGAKHQKKLGEFNLVNHNKKNLNPNYDNNNNNNQNNKSLMNPSQQQQNTNCKINELYNEEIQIIYESLNKNNIKTVDSSKKEEKIFLCNYCNLNLNSLIAYNQHKNGYKHLKKVKEYESVKRQLDQAAQSPSSLTIEGIILETNNVKNTIDVNKAYNSFNCDICHLNLQTKDQLAAHLAGKKHIKKLSGLNNRSYDTINKNLLRNEAQENSQVEKQVGDKITETSNKSLFQITNFNCEICGISLLSQEQLNSHLSGKKHLSKLKSMSKIPIKAVKIAKKSDDDSKFDHLNIAWSKYEIDAALKEQTKNIYDYYCHLCKKYIQRKLQLVDHLKSKKHHAKIIAARNKVQNATSASEDKKQIINKPYFKAKNMNKNSCKSYSKRPIQFVTASNQPMLSANYNNSRSTSNIQSDYDNTQINLVNYGYGHRNEGFNDVYQQDIKSHQYFNYLHSNHLTSQTLQYGIDLNQPPSNSNTLNHFENNMTTSL